MKNTLQELENEIKRISSDKQISEQEIISGLIAHLTQVYNPTSHSEEDKKIIEEIKKKITSKLYKSDKQKKGINRNTKFDELFDLDQVEIKLLSFAFDELEADGDVYAKEFEIGLSEQGIRKYR